MGTKVYNNQPKFLEEIDECKAFKKDLDGWLNVHRSITLV
jgi:hypothetical protein